MTDPVEYVATNLIKRYGSQTVLDIGFLKWSRGEFIALLGKNGCGKSTLIRLLSQQEPFDAGELSFNGESLRSTRLILNPKIAFIAEDHDLPFARPLRHWKDLYQKTYPTFGAKIYDRLQDTLEIDDRKSLNQMSRGQKMKALFCLHAARRPAVYLLDEITAVLDSGSRWSLMEFLSEETKLGRLTVMSTNIASEMQGFATAIVFLDAGRVVFSSSSKDLKAHFVKHRMKSNGEDEAMLNLGARRISYNEDQTWTYLRRRTAEAATIPNGAVSDMREVTIADVQAFFTAGENRL